MGERRPGSLSFHNQRGHKSLGHPEEQPAIAGTQCVRPGRVQILGAVQVGMAATVGFRMYESSPAY